MFHINRINEYIEKYEKQVFIVAMFVYIIVTITGLCFHEPWLDEAQAWLISQDLNPAQVL